MAANLWKVGTSNAFNTTLNGNVLTGDTSITLTSVTGLQAPGVIVIDRQSASNVDTPTVREYIGFTGISSTTITGCTRGLGGSSAQSHQSGAKVEEVFTVTHWNDLITAIMNVLNSSGILDTTKVVDLITVQTLTNKTISGGNFSGTIGGSPTYSGKPIFTVTQPTITTDTDSGTITFDMNVASTHKVILGGNRTLAVTNVANPQAFLIFLKQDSTGSRTVTWWSSINWNNGITPTLTTTANKTDIFQFFFDGINYWGSTVQQGS